MSRALIINRYYRYNGRRKTKPFSIPDLLMDLLIMLDLHWFWDGIKYELYGIEGQKSIYMFNLGN